MPKGVYPHTHIKPKKYPAEMVAKVEELYTADHTQSEIAEKLGVTQRVIWKLMRNHGIQSRVAAKRQQSGTDNHMWRGGDAGYKALHLRVANARGKPSRCDRCGTGDRNVRYEWANLTGDYHNVHDYERMCVSCHRKYDAARRAATGMPTSLVRRSPDA